MASYKSLKSANAQAVPTGLLSRGYNSIPNGFLVCSGQPVSRTTCDLFALIGKDYWRGDGSSTFNFDLDGRQLLFDGTGIRYKQLLPMLVHNG